MKLSQCIKELKEHPMADLEISRLCASSREISPGETFVALPGENSHGLAFAEQALLSGANAVLTPGLSGYAAHPLIIEVPDLIKRLPALMKSLYDLDQAEWSPIAITGTNGKTSCCHFIATGLRVMKQSVGTIGTLGWSLEQGSYNATGLTTPDVVKLYHILHQMHAAGAQHLVMEVSSHALSQKRVEGVPFTTALFTNVTRDHLDYHGSWEAYAAVKASLLNTKTLKAAVFNQDDPYLAKLCQSKAKSIQTLTYSLHDSSADVFAFDTRWSKNRFQASIKTPYGGFDLVRPLVGEFNLSNILGTIAVWLAHGYSLEEITTMSRAVNAVPGRMQQVEGHPKGAGVYVDYAHTPDALEKALKALRPLTSGRLICVVGCGGNRDQGKRPLMGKVADKLADCTIITNDNPRDEDPEAIALDVQSGFSNKNKSMIELDRFNAIGQAIALAEYHDIVLIAGKGHETGQLQAGSVTYFCDVACVQKHMGIK